MVAQGLSLTVIDAPHPLEGDVATYDSRDELRAAHRIWLGSAAGTDWLHEAIEEEFGEDLGWYEVHSRRESTHGGAAVEVATVVLVLTGAGLVDFLRKFYGSFAERLGEASADALLEWARERAREHRKERGLESADGPPDLFDRDLDGLLAGMTGELADALRISEDRLEALSATRSHGVAFQAVYRDRETGREYDVIAGSDWATFTRR